ncbi:hypothetical protein L1987_40782 [Smallanthus sonchifolius]|uniref:Uncharacterized protein n=1 Tax=Smallanthus sonchifolius TaxID=185202 RepID=A0ACB9GTM4_9ASTR|nr:hypothetical protein L1987_40782 [Smallanthus sonchifolius]
MASFDNLTAIEPWMFRSTAGDPWYPDAFARETESALTKALQQSFFNHPHEIEVNHLILNQSDYCSTTASASNGTGTVSGSGSDPETPGSRRRGMNHSLGVSAGTPKKRKPRASKRAMTTFIQADPANFRQMVQEVTGVKLPGSAVVKPEPLRRPFSNKLQGLLPTLDTSAYLLDVQNSHTRRIPVSGVSQLPAMGEVTVNGGGGVDFYSVCSFPTLESSI